MTHFQKAIGQLSKAKQGGLFGKPEIVPFLSGDSRHPDVLGRTKSGKEVSGKLFSSTQEFLDHHKGWSNEDHKDAWKIHMKHQNKAANISNKLGEGPDGYINPHYDDNSVRHSWRYSHAHHEHMIDAHEAMWNSSRRVHLPGGGMATQRQQVERSLSAAYQARKMADHHATYREPQ